MSRVIAMEPHERYDMTPAREYGDVVFLSLTRLNPNSVTENIKFAADRLTEIRFDPEHDFICMSGQVLCVTALFAAVTYDYDTFPILLFNYSQGRYEAHDYNSPGGNDDQSSNDTIQDQFQAG